MEKKLITVLVSDQDDQLENLIRHIKAASDPGHSFEVICDPDSDEEKSFGFDGDGAFAIRKIRVTNLTEV
jgi:hypothetical protein